MTTSIWTNKDLDDPSSHNWKYQLRKHLQSSQWRAIPMRRMGQTPRPFCFIFSRKYAERVDSLAGDARRQARYCATKLLVVMATGKPETTWGIMDNHCTFWLKANPGSKRPRAGFGLWIERGPTAEGFDTNWHWSAHFIPKLQSHHIQNLIFSFLKAKPGRRWAYVSSDTPPDTKYKMFTYQGDTFSSLDSYLNDNNWMVSSDLIQCEEQDLIDLILKRDSLPDQWSSFLLLHYELHPSISTLTDILAELEPLYNELTPEQFRSD